LTAVVTFQPVIRLLTSHETRTLVPTPTAPANRAAFVEGGISGSTDEIPQAPCSGQTSIRLSAAHRKWCNLMLTNSRRFTPPTSPSKWFFCAQRADSNPYLQFIEAWQSINCSAL
jgi:hypothetical protein